MALNFSRRPIFPAQDNLVSPVSSTNGYLVEGAPERSGDGLVRPWSSSQDRVDVIESPESVSKDILDLLPSDPFGMGMTTTFSALTSWLEDLEVDYGRNAGGNNRGGEYELFAGLNLIWNKAVQFQTLPSNTQQFAQKSNTLPDDIFDQDGDLGSGSASIAPDCFMSLENKVTTPTAKPVGESQKLTGSWFNGNAGGAAPHAALPFTLRFLSVRDLLSVGQVCKPLQSIVQNDPLLWRSIHIGKPLNERITNDILLELTSRAQGSLQSLCLVECLWITNDGLKRVLENNPKLIKLCVPGCARLSIMGILTNLRALKSNGALGIKHLRIGGIIGGLHPITSEHLEELMSLLGADVQVNYRKPHFYQKGNLYISCDDDDRAIDIEMCPRCQRLKLVYDCPNEACQEKADGLEACRACRICIPRCFKCGRCIDDREYEETFFFELVCSSCKVDM